MIIINKKIGVTILCLLMISTGCTTQKLKEKNVQTTLSKPKVVIEEFFKYYNQRNLEGINSLTTESLHSSELSWGFDNLEYIKILSVVEDNNQANKEIYIRSNIHATEKNYIIDMDKEKLELENINIFKVDFDVKYKKEGIGPKDSGRDNYTYILIRKDIKSPWLIDSFGY